MPNQRIEENGFTGLEAGMHPDSMPAGTLQSADNVFLDGLTEGQGAALTTRPGMRAQLSATLGLVLANNYPYQMVNGTGKIYFAAGNQSNTAGRIYEWTKGQPTAVHKTALGAFQETAVRFARLSKYLFIAGATGSTGVRMKRYDPELDVVIDAEGVATPQYRPTAVRSNIALRDVSGAYVFSQRSEWGYDYFTSGIGITQSAFESGSLSTLTAGQFLCPGVTSWLVQNGPVEAATNVWSVYPSVRFLRLDDPGSSVITDSAARYPNPAKINVNGVGASVRRAVSYLAFVKYKATGPTDSIVMTLIAYDNGGNETARDSWTITSVVEDAVVYLGHVFSFAGLVSDTEVISLGIELTAGAGNDATSSGPYISEINLVPTFTDPFSDISIVDDNESAGRIAFQAFEDYYRPSAQQDTAGVYIGQQRFTYDLDGAQDFSNRSQIAIECKPFYEFSPFRVRLGVRDGTAGTAYYTDDLETVEDESGKTYLVGDLSVIEANNRTAVRYLELYFPDDLQMPSGQTNRGQSLFNIGKLTDAGGLQPGFTYDWRIVEKETTSGIVSGGGPITNPVIGTTYEATGRINLTGATSLPADSDANRLVVYRRSNSFEDGWFRKVAEFAPGGDATGTFWTWTASTKEFVDKTPDSTLDLNEAGDIDYWFSDHQPPPTDVKEIAVYNRRLVASTNEGIWVERVAPIDAATGLYWNRVEDKSDPQFADQGFFSRITGGDGAMVGGAAVRMTPYQEVLVIFFQDAIYLLGGDDATNFYIRRFEGDEGKGLIAPLAMTTFNNLLVYLSSDGLRGFDLAKTERISRPIDRLLNPKGAFVGAALSAGGYRKASLVGHAGRLYLSVPKPGESTVGASYVLDSRGGGWTRWNLGEVASGVVLDSSGDTDDLYFLTGESSTTAGQLYNVGYAFGDTRRLGDTPTGVVAVVKGRGYVSEDGKELYAKRFGATVECTDPVSATFIVTGDGAAAKSWTQGYTFDAGGGSARRLFVADRARGRVLEWQTNITATTSPVTIQRVSMEMNEGRDV